MKLVLYSYWRSSASHRVRIGLGLKQLPYEYVAVDLLHGANRTDEYLVKNPAGQVPTLEITEDDGSRTALTQSLAILEYLDERWPDLPLLPRDPLLRARARALAEIFNSGVQPLQNIAVLRKIKALGGDEAAWIRPVIADGLATFARISAGVAGTFSVGDVPTLADVCLVPQLAGARRFQVDLEPYPKLLAIEAHCLPLPAFADAMPHHQPDAVKS
ncbi:MAG TPA: maleylacetoacetate isomerase [Kofleriaceae bacterium]|jgi:maleylpyruvate isomerase|nr:maleylacetoacetate isomerase [Kofleriaceae bacterium]